MMRAKCQHHFGALQQGLGISERVACEILKAGVGSDPPSIACQVFEGKAWEHLWKESIMKGKLL